MLENLLFKIHSNVSKVIDMSGNLLSKIYSNISGAEEAVDFDPANVKFIEGNDVAYGLSCEDNGNGTSKVKLLVSPSYPLGEPVIHNIGNIRNEFKDQLSLTLIKDSAEINKVGIIFPEEAINKNGEKYERLSFNTYEVKLSVGAPSVKHLDTTKLQKHINNDNPANIGNIYSQPEVVKISDNQVLVTAKNLKDKTLVSWILNKNKKSGKYEALEGKKNIIERKLLKDSPDSQFVLNGSTLLYLRVERGITEIFKFNTAEIVKDLKRGKGIDEYLLGNKNGQIDIKKAPFFSGENEISFLQYVIEQDKDNDVVAFLEKDPSSNTQVLRLVGFRSGEPLLSFPIYRFKDSIEQLYVKEDSQGGFIVTAVSGENVITFYAKSFEESPKVMIIPVSEIKTFSNFVSIINGQLPPNVISSSTVAPMTVTEEAETPNPTNPNSSTVEQGTVADATPTDATSIATEPDEGYESSTESMPTDATSIATKPDEGYESSTESTPTDATSIATKPDEGYESSTESMPTDATSTKQVVRSTNAPTTPNSPTQKVFTISTEEILTGKSSIPMFTTPLLPQENSSPQPTQAFTMSTKEILTTEKPTIVYTTPTERIVGSTNAPTISNEPTDRPTPELTPHEFSAITPKDATSTKQVVSSTNAPAISNEPTDGSTPGPAPEPHDFSAAAARNTEIGAVGGVLGALLALCLGYVVYKKCIQRRNNTAPILHVECGEGSHDDIQLDTTSYRSINGVLTMDTSENGGLSETSLNHVSATLGTSRSSSPSSSSSDEELLNNVVVESGSSQVNSNDQPKSLLERVMSCCWIGRKSSEIELNNVLVSSSESPEGSIRSSLV